MLYGPTNSLKNKTARFNIPLGFAISTWYATYRWFNSSYTCKSKSDCYNEWSRLITFGLYLWTWYSIKGFIPSCSWKKKAVIPSVDAGHFISRRHTGFRWNNRSHHGQCKTSFSNGNRYRHEMGLLIDEKSLTKKPNPIYQVRPFLNNYFFKTPLLHQFVDTVWWNL